MSNWNGKRFSVYESEEKSVLKMLKHLGDQTNYNTDEIEVFKNNDNKKMTKEEYYDDIERIRKIDSTGNFTGSWFGLKKPTLSEEGAFAQTEKNQYDLEIRRKNTVLFNRFLFNLRRLHGDIRICCMGDSMTYGTDTNSSDKKAADTSLTDDGTKHLATRASKTYPEVLQRELNKIYDNNITVINHGYSGDGTKKGYLHWNASMCDLCIINYGINDAINENIEYMGSIKEFIKWYRLIIERELENDTAVILITPPKQLIISTSGKDGRTSVDVFSNAVYMLGQEYNIPVIDGHLIMEGYGSEYYSDTTHHNSKGYETYACNLLGILIGEGANKPYKINGYDMLGANILLDNFVLSNGSLIANSEAYPTPIECNGTSPSILLKDGQSVTYSFYCEQPQIVAIPSLYSASKNCNVIVKLDRGVEQPQPQNYFYFHNQNNIDRSKKQESSITIKNKDLIDYSNKVYTLKNTLKNTDPHLIIMRRGWHTITISTNFGNSNDSCTLYGIEFLTYNDYLNRVVEEVELNLVNCEPYDKSRTPKLTLNNGYAELTGTIKNFVSADGGLIAEIGTTLAPATNVVFPIALSSSTGGGYGTISITSGGKILIPYLSSSVNYASLYGIRWKVNVQ